MNTFTFSRSITGADGTQNVTTADTVNFSITGAGSGFGTIFPIATNCSVTTSVNATGGGTESGSITFTGSSTATGYSVTWQQTNVITELTEEVTLSGAVDAAPTVQAPTITADNISLRKNALGETIEDATANDNNECIGYKIFVKTSEGGSGDTFQYQFSGQGLSPNTRSYTSDWTIDNFFIVGGEWGRSSWTITPRAITGGTINTGTTTDPTTLPITKPYFGYLTLTPTSRTITSSTPSTDFTVDVEVPVNDTVNIMPSITDFRLIDGSSNELASREGEGTLTVTSSTTGWPLEGQTTTFTVWGTVVAADGGNDLYESSGVTGSIVYEGTDDDPDAFSFDADVASAVAGQVYESSTETITGINTGADISISGTGSPQYKINTGNYTSTAGTIYNNDQVTVRVTASNTASATNTGTLSIGPTKTADFSVTTAAASSGGSGTLPGVSGTYGLELYGTDGSSLLFSPAHRTFNYIAEDTATLASNASTSLTGIKNATDETKVSVGVVVELWFANPISITRSSANGGTITFTNNSSFTETFTYFITRIG